MKVEFTQAALKDLLQIYDYYLVEASADVAQMVIDELQKSVNRLTEFPESGSIPKELRAISNHKFRQLIVRHYRLIYQVTPTVIYISAVLDGRRDIQTLLQRRLLN